MTKRNLLQETEDYLASQELAPKDVVWVGDLEGKLRMSWDTFAERASNLEYIPRGQVHDISDSGYFEKDNFGYRVPLDLVVVGRDWFLRRAVHDKFTKDELPRENAKYSVSPERWEIIRYPKVNSGVLVDEKAEIKLICDGSSKHSKNLVTLNKSSKDDTSVDSIKRAPIKERHRVKRRIIGGF